jgi:cell division protein FtsW (lipid II flippase)
VNERPRRSVARSSDVSRAGARRASSGSSSRRHKPDYWILVLSAFFLTVGLVVVYSISPGLAASQHISQSYFITKQLIAVGYALAAFHSRSQS